MTTRVGVVTSTLDHGLSGPNRVLLNICNEINNRSNTEFEFKYIHNEPSDLSIYTRSNEVIVPRAPGLFERSLSNLDLDIIYYPHFPKLRPGFFFLDAKKVVHLHGDLPYALPSLMSFPAKYKQYSLAAFYRWTQLSHRVDKYLVASDSLVQNKKRELGVPDEKFVHTELAPAISTQSIEQDDVEQTLERLNISSNYMLDVASQSSKKNVRNLIKAVKILHERGIAPPLLVVAGNWKGTDLYRYGNETLGGDIIFTGYIGDNELNHLYHGAELYVNPTRHETFGLTNLEAMTAGLPIVTSNRFAIPEVVGDTARLVNNPEDIGEIASHIEFLLNNEDERERLAKKAKERAEQFSWERTVNKILSVFEELN